MFQVMAELEGLCARLAAQRLSRADRERLLAAHERCRVVAEREGAEGFYRENNVFHDVIYATSRNSFLEAQTRALRNRLGPYRRYITFMPGRIEGSLVEHQQIVDALLEGDQEAAHGSMRDHLDVLARDLASMITDIDTQPWDILAQR
jgi:DNA-binding GntR family transcriptional regulator